MAPTINPLSITLPIALPQGGLLRKSLNMLWLDIDIWSAFRLCSDLLIIVFTVACLFTIFLYATDYKRYWDMNWLVQTCQEMVWHNRRSATTLKTQI